MSTSQSEGIVLPCGIYHAAPFYFLDVRSNEARAQRGKRGGGQLVEDATKHQLGDQHLVGGVDLRGRTALEMDHLRGDGP